jgi:hypothetical protein
MATANVTRRAGKRGAKTTEPAFTLADRDESTRALIAIGDASHLATVRALHFCENDYNMPIAGAGRPAPCPFCGVTEVSVIIETRDTDGGMYVHVECGHCGCEAPGTDSANDAPDKSTYALVLKACVRWNSRGRLA